MKYILKKCLSHVRREWTSYEKEVVLYDLSVLFGEFYKVETDDKITDSCKYPLALIQSSRDQKQTSTGGLAKLLKLKIAAKLILTVNIDIQDLLTAENIRHIEITQCSVPKVYVKFSDKQIGSRAMRSSS